MHALDFFTKINWVSWFQFVTMVMGAMVTVYIVTVAMVAVAMVAVALVTVDRVQSL